MMTQVTMGVPILTEEAHLNLNLKVLFMLSQQNRSVEEEEGEEEKVQLLYQIFQKTLLMRSGQP